LREVNPGMLARIRELRAFSARSAVRDSSLLWDSSALPRSVSGRLLAFIRADDVASSSFRDVDSPLVLVSCSLPGRHVRFDPTRALSRESRSRYRRLTSRAGRAETTRVRSESHPSPKNLETRPLA